MSKWVVDIHGEIEGDYDIIKKYDEQEPILDKIRAEIDENINYNKKMNYQGIVAGLLLTRNIIDKYNIESEDKENDKRNFNQC